MSQFAVEGFLEVDTPAVFDVKITVYSDYDGALLDPRNALPDEYDFKAIIDTGSRQCLINPGFFANRHFGSRPLSCDMVHAGQIAQQCRGQLMSLSFSSRGRTKTIRVPIYEMQLDLMDGYVLIGRSILDHALFCYDGPNRKAAMTFPNDNFVQT